MLSFGGGKRLEIFKLKKKEKKREINRNKIQSCSHILL